MARKYVEVTTPEECREYYRLGLLQWFGNRSETWHGYYPSRDSTCWKWPLSEWEKELQVYKHAILVDEDEDG